MSTPISLRVQRVHRVLGVDERAHAAELLGLGEDVVDERRLARGLRAEDLDDAPARHAADAEREVERQRAGRDRVDADLRARVAHAHDGALAELALDLRERALQRGVAGLGGLLLFGRHGVGDLSALALREQCSVDARSDGTRPYGCSCHGSTRDRDETAAQRAQCALRGQLHARERLVARRSAARPGASGYSITAPAVKVACGASGRSAIRGRHSRRTRATVTCARKRPRLGLATAGRRPAARRPWPAARRARRRRPRARPSARAAGAGPATARRPRLSTGAGEPATRAHGLARAGRPRRARDGRGRRASGAGRPRATGAARGRRAAASRPKAASAGADVGRQVERRRRGARSDRSAVSGAPSPDAAAAAPGAWRRSSSGRGRRRGRRAGVIDARQPRAVRARHAKQTSPTGFSSVPPPGPAMPVMPTPTSAPALARAPSASASATSAETAPTRSISAGSTPASADLGLVGVDDERRRARSPTSRRARSAAPASSPPVHDSAVAIVSPRARSRSATCSSTVEPSSENSVSAWRSRTRLHEARRRRGSAAGA